MIFFILSAWIYFGSAESRFARFAPSRVFASELEERELLALGSAHATDAPG